MIWAAVIAGVAIVVGAVLVETLMRMDPRSELLFAVLDLMLDEESPDETPERIGSAGESWKQRAA